VPVASLDEVVAEFGGLAAVGLQIGETRPAHAG
jgi:hypothetical protein